MHGDSGNDDDGEEKIPVPVKTVDKKTTGTAKRNVEPQAPVRGPGGNRRGGPSGNEGGMYISRIVALPEVTKHVVLELSF